MNFEFSSDQLQLKDEARKVLEDLSSPSKIRKVVEAGLPLDRQLWTTLGEVGFLSAAIPEAYGGTGAGYLELCVIAEELGRALAPVPFASSICLGAELILAAGTEQQKLRYVPSLASGKSIACLALAEGPGRLAPEAITASAKARQAIDFPEASEGTYRCFCCSVPAARINSAPRQMDEANGTGAKARPNSSAITHSSKYPAPVPPYASGMAADRKPTSPSVVHSWRSSGKPASTTLRILEGELRSSRTLRASSLSCSWSEENSKFIAV